MSIEVDDAFGPLGSVDEGQRRLTKAFQPETHYNRRDVPDEDDEDDEYGELERKKEVTYDDEGNILVLYDKASIMAAAGLDADTRAILEYSMDGLPGLRIGASGTWESAYTEAIESLGTLNRSARRGIARLKKTQKFRRGTDRKGLDKKLRTFDRKYKNQTDSALKDFKARREQFRRARDNSRQNAKDDFETAWAKTQEALYKTRAGKLETKLTKTIAEIDGLLGTNLDEIEKAKLDLTERKKVKLEKKKQQYVDALAIIEAAGTEPSGSKAAWGQILHRATPVVPGKMVVEHAGTLYSGSPLANPHIGNKYAKRVFKWDADDMDKEREDAIAYYKKRTDIDFAKAKKDEATGALIYSIKDKSGKAHQAAKLEAYALNAPALTEANGVTEITGFGGDADVGATMHEVGFKLTFLRKVKIRGELDGLEVPAYATMYYGKWIVANEMDNPEIDPNAVLMHFETPEPSALTAGDSKNKDLLHVKYDVLYQDLRAPFSQEHVGEAQRKVSYLQLREPEHMHAGKSVACKTKCITKIKFND